MQYNELNKKILKFDFENYMTMANLQYIYIIYSKNIEINMVNTTAEYIK